MKSRTLLAAPLALAASVREVLRVTSPENAFVTTKHTKEHEATQQGRTSTAAPAPQFVNPNSWDIIHAHWVLPNAVPAALAARVRGLPLVISLHGSDVFLAEQAPPLSLAAAGAMQAAAGITACSGDLRDRALRLGARDENFAVVPYGVDASTFQPDPTAAAQVRAELSIDHAAPLVISVSRLVYKKGLTYLLAAFPTVLQQHPTAALVLAGYGDLREELERQAEQLGIANRVFFPGQLDRVQAARYIAAADVYAVPSVRDQSGNVDGLPNALLEGMGVGRPIIASRVAGIPEVIDHERHGLLVAERDVAGLAQAITRLLDNREFAAQLGAAARQRVLTELTWDATAAQFEQVYARARGTR